MKMQEAYRWLAEGKVLGTRKMEVLRCIMKYPEQTDREITKQLGYTDPNKVRPTRKRLYDVGLITRVGYKMCNVTGKMASTWGIKSYWDTDSLKNKRPTVQIKRKNVILLINKYLVQAKTKKSKELFKELKSEVFKL